MTTIDQANQRLQRFNRIVNRQKCYEFDHKESLKVGVDLGTSSIVLTVLDQQNQPVYGCFEHADVVRDGLIVNYGQAVEIVRRLKGQAEDVLGVSLVLAAGAVPPGTVGRNQDVVGNIIESAEMAVSILIDEPTAASTFLGITEGAVVDIGGGTTGISIFKSGKVIYVNDEPTGGHHISLVLAGHHRISLAEAEILKRDVVEAESCFPIVRPVVEKMAEITRQSLCQFPSDSLYLVGGATCLNEFAPTFSHYLKQPIQQPIYPQFVTPLGIAMSSCEGGRLWKPS